eukprot:gene15879-biopygen6290
MMPYQDCQPRFLLIRNAILSDDNEVNPTPPHPPFSHHNALRTGGWAAVAGSKGNAPGGGRGLRGGPSRRTGRTRAGRGRSLRSARTGRRRRPRDARLRARRAQPWAGTAAFSDVCVGPAPS